MLSRNRTTSGFGGYVRATTNPDPDSFVRELIDWWIDPDGYPIPERSGVIRYFTRERDEIVWHDKKVNDNAKSFTFIPAKLTDNPILMKNDPGYVANLESLNYVDRMRLLGGNWNVRATAGTMFKRRYFKMVDAYERGGPVIRYWDRASSTKNEAAYTVGLKMTKMPSGRFCIIDVQRFRATPGNVMQSIKNIAAQDGKEVLVGIEQDPGQAGVAEAQSYVTALAGFNVKLYPARQDKITRAKPLSAQAEFGNVDILCGDWNEAFIRELEAFPESDFKDQVDSASGAFNALTSGVAGVFTKAMAQKTGTMGSRGGSQW
jgi:predicted phage terminase large subunit-like protein